ncbi:MAG: Cna B-type domain-containing protein [Clostridia bacterium]|nr:Cna B-type domain-containing protein [Clostridia bacterium]
MDNPLFEMEVQNWYVSGQDEPEGVYIKALKVWDDLDDFDGIRPESVQVKLSATVNGVTYTLPDGITNPITLSEDNDWNTGNKWYNLPVTDEAGHEISYSVEEVSVPDGYTCSTKVSENGTDKSYTFTNTHRPQGSGKITLQKNVIAPAGVTTPDTYYFIITDSDGHYWTDHSVSGPDGYYTAIPIPVNEATGTVEIEVPVGRYTVAEVRDGIQINGYSLTVTGEGTFDVRANQNEEVVITNQYDEQITPPDDKHIHIGLEKKWIDGDGNTTPPDGASATFVLHQQKSTKESGSTGNFTVYLYGPDITLLDTTKANAGDVIKLTYTSEDGKYPYTNISVLAGNYWSYIVNIGGNGEVTYDYKVQESDAVNKIIKLKIDNEQFLSECKVVPYWNNGGVTYTDYANTNYTQTVTLPASDGKWKYVFRNLVQEDENGNLYRYYITEESCTPAAVSTVFKDNLGADAAHAISTNGQTVEVTNTWKNQEPPPVQVLIEGRKELKNKVLEAKEFSFILQRVDEKLVSLSDAPVRTQNDEDGHFAFTELTFTYQDFMANRKDDGKAVFYYLVVEDIPDGVNASNIKDGIRYDDAKYLVTVTLTYDTKENQLEKQIYIQNITKDQTLMGLQA